MSRSTPFLEKCATISLESMSEESLREPQRTAQKILTANKSVDTRYILPHAFKTTLVSCLLVGYLTTVNTLVKNHDSIVQLLHNNAKVLLLILQREHRTFMQTKS